jgi:two-component system chemotaxis sensor kinase CheA
MVKLDQLLPVFIEEAHSAMREVDVYLNQLEASPTSKDDLDQIARLLHSVKGASGFLGLSKTEALCATCETLLCAIYDGLVSVDTQVIHVLRMARGDISALLVAVERDGIEGDSKTEHVIRRIHAITGALNH